MTKTALRPVQKAVQGVFLRDLYIQVIQLCTACIAIYRRETCTSLIQLTVQRVSCTGVHTLIKVCHLYTSTFVGVNMTIDYREYIQSKEWKSKSKAAKHRAGYRCEQCGMMKPEHLLHTHHLTYERLGYERKSDLKVLCSDCHAEEHGIRRPGIPTHKEIMAWLRKV
jgi:5-methylcytosine-specific restriction endonuclease McrA